MQFREIGVYETKSVILTKIEKEDTENEEFFNNGVFTIPAFVPKTTIPIIGIDSHVIDGINTIETRFSLDDDIEDKFPNNITQIIIPASVESIGSFLFKECKNLKEVKFSKNSKLKDIAMNAFKGCLSLEKIDIPESVEKIGVDAFRQCTSLKSLTIPAGTTFMYCFSAFEGCSNIEELHFLGKVLEMKFSDKYGIHLYEEANVEELTTIGAEFIGDFRYKLKRITIPFVKEIFPNMFCNCENLTENPIQKNFFML